MYLYCSKDKRNHHSFLLKSRALLFKTLYYIKMKKRDPIKQNKLQKITNKRALYEKARKQKRIAKKQVEIESKNKVS